MGPSLTSTSRVLALQELAMSRWRTSAMLQAESMMRANSVIESIIKTDSAFQLALRMAQRGL